MKYVIGYDFGTLSVRCILLNVENGEQICDSASNYSHGVMDSALPSGKKLPYGFALQHPMDYISSMKEATEQMLEKGGISPEDVLGIGIDFTSSTILPIDADGLPLCIRAEFSDDPHAYTKLWKHHGAVSEAEEIEKIARDRREDFLPIYGGSVSCEWALPKILETLRKSPSVFSAASGFVEGGDFVCIYLTGNNSRSLSFAGYKSFRNTETGYPCNDFYTNIDKNLDGFIGNKIPCDVVPIGDSFGVLNKRGAELLGLCEGCKVASPIIDAHAFLPALNMTRAGDITMILGTSGCYIVNCDEGRPTEGLWGYVKDSVIPGIYTYEAGQSAFGDALSWFAGECVPREYYNEADERGIDIHTLLTEKASKLYPGETGLISLDWFNGNRSILSDSDLSGMILGLTLKTRPEHIYRAIAEGVAFGARTIVEQYEKCGIPIRRVAASGGIAGKNPMLMQILADVLDREITVSPVKEAGARGSAIYAAVAAGIYPSVISAAEKFDIFERTVYSPSADASRVYGALYSEYRELHDRFGREDKLMHRLREIARSQEKRKLN